MTSTSHHYQVISGLYHELMFVYNCCECVFVDVYTLGKLCVLFFRRMCVCAVVFRIDLHSLSYKFTSKIPKHVDNVYRFVWCIDIDFVCLLG